ncbi:MAG: hypothetical protein WCW01_03115 [Gammaproteobacteria bacterium]
MPSTRLTLSYKPGQSNQNIFLNKEYTEDSTSETLHISLEDVSLPDSISTVQEYLQTDLKPEVLVFSQSVPNNACIHLYEQLHTYEGWCDPFLPFAQHLEKNQRNITINLADYQGISGGFMAGLFVVSQAFPNLQFSFENKKLTPNKYEPTSLTKTWTAWQSQGISAFPTNYTQNIVNSLTKTSNKELKDITSKKITQTLMPPSPPSSPSALCNLSLLAAPSSSKIKEKPISKVPVNDYKSIASSREYSK